MDMKRLIKVAWFTPTTRGWGLPIAFVASPGMSKTAQIRQVAMECGMPCEILSPGERGEGAFGVVPVPSDGVLTYPPPEWISNFTTPQEGQNPKKFTPRGVVFVDELTTCFAAGTWVLMDDSSYMNISDIKPGMRVVSWDVTRMKQTIRTVTATTQHQPRATVKVVDSHGGITICTPDHLFWTANGWRAAETLNQKTHLLTQDGILNGIGVQVAPAEFQPVYDITVERDHCFFANGHLVHNCPPALQPPLLGLFLEGRIGGHVLPPGVRTIAAYNNVDEAAAGYELPPPLANRMGHIPFDPGGVEEWTDWLVGANGIGSHVKQTMDAAAEEKRVLGAWPEAFATAKGKVAAFLRARPALIHKMPPPHDPSASRAWPSRRTFEFATRALATSEVHGVDEDIETMLIASFVGDAVAGELYTFLREEALPNPADILDGVVEFKHSKDKRRLDRTFAILAACTALVVPENAKKRDDRAKALWEIIHKIAKAGAKDVVFGAAQRLAKSGHLRHKESRPALALLQGVMEAAGIGGR